MNEKQCVRMDFDDFADLYEMKVEISGKKALMQFNENANHYGHAEVSLNHEYCDLLCLTLDKIEYGIENRKEEAESYLESMSLASQMKNPRSFLTNRYSGDL